jgi:hypothetical protein
VLGTAVLSFVLLQDEYKSVLLSGVFRTAIATVGCRCYGDLPKISSFDPLCFAVIDRNVYSMAHFRMLFANIHNYAGRSDSLGIIVLPAKRSVSSILRAARSATSAADASAGSSFPHGGAGREPQPRRVAW